MKHLGNSSPYHFEDIRLTGAGVFDIPGVALSLYFKESVIEQSLAVAEQLMRAFFPELRLVEITEEDLWS